MGRPAVEFDETRWPIVVATLRGSLTAEDYEGLFERGEAMMARREPCVTIVDLREVTAIADAKQRQRIAEWAGRMDDTYGHVIVGSVMVVQSALVRGALTAIQWLRPAKSRKEVWVGTMDDALQEADKLLPRTGQSELRKRRAAD